jgi:membrane-associated phospholipid phosphatase
VGPSRVFDARRARALRPRVLVLPPIEEHVRGSAIDVGALDRAALDLAQTFTHPILDWIASAIGLLGIVEVTSGLALGMAVARWRRHQRDAFAPLLIFVAIAVEAVLKIAVAHSPPPGDLVRTVEIIPTLHAPFANSFPSGHVMRITFLAAITRSVPSWMSSAVVILMVLSRVYLAEHWLSDCVGGLVIGLITAGLAYAVFARPAETMSPPRGRPGGPTRR